MFNCVRHILPVPVPLDVFSSLLHGQPLTTTCHRPGTLDHDVDLYLMLMLRLRFAFRCCLPISWRQPLTAVVWDSGSCPKETCSPPLTWRWVFWGLLWSGQRQIHENVDNGSKTKTIVLVQGGLVKSILDGDKDIKADNGRKTKMMDFAQGRLVSK